MTKDFDTILEDVGSFGKYQKMMLILVICPTSFLIAVQVSTVIFQTVIPDHWCDVPGIENTDMTASEWKNFTIPWDDGQGGYSSCEQFQIVWTEGFPSRSNATEECSSWQYDRSLMVETVATTNDWVCQKEQYSVHILSMGTIGSSLSTLLLPIIADKYIGRRPMFFISISIHLVFSFFVIFSHNFYLHTTLRFLAAWSFQANYQTSYMIAMEFLAPDKRNMAEFLSFASWALGACMTSVLCWALGDWRYITVSILFMDVLMWGLWKFLPESPRWLLAKHRVKETFEVMVKVAEVNQMADQLDRECLMKELEAVENPIENEVSLIAVIKYPKFCLRAFCLFLLSGATFLVYGILSLNINVLPNRYFMNSFLIYLIEIPSNMASAVAVHYIGRRSTSFISYFICILSSIFAILLVEQKVTLFVLVAIMKFVITMGLYNVYLQVTEIYPTTLRSTGMGAIAVFGTGALAVVPYIINSDAHAALNYFVILGASILCVLSTIPVPETLGLPLPQTLPEANSLGDDRPLHKWVHYWNLSQYSKPSQEKPSQKEEAKKMLG